MESGQSSHSSNQPIQSMPMDIFGNEVGSDQVDRKPLITEQMGLNQTESVQLPWWVHQEPSTNQNYVKYLAESSAFAQTVIPSEPDVMFESLPLPAGAISCDVSGLSDFNTDLSYNLYLGQACGSASNELDSWKFNEDLGNQFPSRQHQAQSSWIQNPSGDSSCNNVSRVAAPVGSPTQPRPRASSAKSRANDRRRRIQINERLTALQELLPHSGEGRQASIMDDIIDYAKNLQLQIKDACKRKTRLECESTIEPIIFREGYGHYFCDEQVLNEPLEEMVGKLLELNPTEALQLLETKGLLLMPIEFAEGFC